MRKTVKELVDAFMLRTDVLPPGTETALPPCKKGPDAWRVLLKIDAGLRIMEGSGATPTEAFEDIERAIFWWVRRATDATESEECDQCMLRWFKREVEVLGGKAA